MPDNHTHEWTLKVVAADVPSGQLIFAICRDCPIPDGTYEHPPGDSVLSHGEIHDRLNATERLSAEDAENILDELTGSFSGDSGPLVEYAATLKEKPS